MRTLPRMLSTAFILTSMVMLVNAQTQATAPVTVQAAVDRIVQQEARTAQLLRTYSPRIETYIQEEQPDRSGGLLRRAKFWRRRRMVRPIVSTG